MQSVTTFFNLQDHLFDGENKIMCVLDKGGEKLLKFFIGLK